MNDVNHLACGNLGVLGQQQAEHNALLNWQRQQYATNAQLAAWFPPKSLSRPLSPEAIACYRRARTWRRIIRVASAVWSYVKEI